MVRSKELLIIRYSSILILFYQLFLQKEEKSIIAFGLMLLLIINNNLRVFYFNTNAIILSIVMELLAVPFIQNVFGGTIIFYLLGASIDIFNLKNKKVKFSLATVTLGIAIFVNPSISIESKMSTFILLVVFFALLNYISDLYKTKLEAQKLYDKLKVSEEKIIESNKELEGYVDSIEEITLLKERNRISREIHDSVGHALSTAIIQLSAMETIANKEKSSLEGMLYNLREFINESFQDVKKAVRELKPNEYENYEGILRLEQVCKNFENMTGVQVKVNILKGDWNLSTKQINHLYRITQEVLSNSLRHGKATKIKVIMNFNKDEFILSFNDNGIGSKHILESGIGLKSIKERIKELNGQSYFKSNSERGFFVKVVVPKEVEV